MPYLLTRVDTELLSAISRLNLRFCVTLLPFLRLIFDKTPYVFYRPFMAQTPKFTKKLRPTESILGTGC